MSNQLAYKDYVMTLVDACGVGKGDNLRLFPVYSHGDVPEDETVITEFTAPDGRKLYFTYHGFTVPGHGFIYYQNVRHASWTLSVKGLEHDHREYLEIHLNDRTGFKLHVGRRSISLTGFIKVMKAAIENA